MKTLHYGLTEITFAKNHVVINHNGNMGNTAEHSVRPNVDALLGLGAFNYLRERGIEQGTPSYSYALTVPNFIYNSWKDRHANS